MIIYGSSLSPFVRKLLAYAREKDLDFDSHPVGPGDSSVEFREASPFGKIPAMRDGDFLLPDSSAIIHYLETKHPSPAMIPATPQARGQVIWWEEFADTMMSACVGKVFFHRIVAPLFMGKAGDSDVADVCERDELVPLLRFLEQTFAERDYAERKYLIGDSLTLADLAVASPLANFGHAEVSFDEYPTMTAWRDLIFARPSFAAMLEWERSLIAKMRSKMANQMGT